MMKLLSTLTLVLALSASVCSAQKTVYIPQDFNRNGADDYCRKHGVNGVISSIDDLVDANERWAKVRTYETENIICFWEAGFGTNPKTMKRPDATSQTFDLTAIMAECDSIIKFHAYTLGGSRDGAPNFERYKFLFMLSYTTNWVAYGGGYDYKIGAMWVNPAAIGVGSTAEYKYGTLAHELFHSISYQAYADRIDNTYDAFQGSGVSGSAKGPFWERSANNAASTLYPYINWDWVRYAYATQNHYMSTRRHYATSFFLEELRNNFGMDALGRIWRENKTTEKHPMLTTSRLFFNNNQAAQNDFIARTAMKTITFDFPSNSNGWFQKTVQESVNYESLYNSTGNVDIWNLASKPRFIPYAVDYNNLHFAIRDCQAPQDYGFNVIRLYPTDAAKSVSIYFKGHKETAAKEANKQSGWRWAFVSVSAAGLPRYGTVHSEDEGAAKYELADDDAALYIVVTGAPKVHNDSHVYRWEAGFPKYYRYPYEFRLDGAVPEGYQPDYQAPAAARLTAHPNGGGMVASTASVDATAYVAPNAKVLGNAKVQGAARIEDFAVVKGAAIVKDNAVVKENALVFGTAQVYGNAIVSGAARVFNASKIYDDAFVTDNAFLSQTSVFDNAIACGNLWQRDGAPYSLSGTAIAGGDCESAGNTSDGAEVSGTFLQWPEQGNNSRRRKDGLGNLTTVQIEQLRENWNDIPTRFTRLNASHTTNSDINSSYTYFASEELTIPADVAPDNITAFEVDIDDLPDGEYIAQDPRTGGYLTPVGTQLIFAVRDQDNPSQIWTVNRSTSYKKYRFVDKQNRTIKADGTLTATGSTGSSSYIFSFEHRKDENLYAVFNKSNKYYWRVKDNTLDVTGYTMQNGYPIRLLTPEGYGVGVPSLPDDTPQITYSSRTRELHITATHTDTLMLLSLQGVVQGKFDIAVGENIITLPQLPTGVYVVATAGKAVKLVVNN